MATGAKPGLLRYKHLHDLIWTKDLVNVATFVENEDITPEGYHDLLNQKAIELFFVKPSNPLTAAALVNAPDIVKYFISLGFDPDGDCLGDDEKPIHAACRNCPYHPDDDEDNEKKRQARRDNLEVVRILVEDYKVDVNVVKSDMYLYRDYTPLRYAAQEGEVEVVKLLVEAGADVKVEDPNTRETVLHCATTSGSAELCEYFLALGLKVGDAKRCGRVPLDLAVEHGHLKVAEVLLDAGADVNRIRPSGISLLRCAVEVNNKDMIHLLCSRGANIEEDTAQYRRKGPLLYQAIESCDYGIVRYFVVEKGVPLNTRDFNQNTPFSVAIKTGKIKVAILLLSCGCKQEHVPEGFMSDHLKEGCSFVKKLREMSENPRKLMDICCFKIRSLLGNNIEESVNALKFPQSLKDFLTLKHV